MKKIVHIAKDKSGKWVVRADRAKSHGSKFPTKKDALASARTMSRNGGTLVVHDAKGKIQQVITLRTADTPRLKRAKVSHRMSADSVNAAIVEVVGSKQGVG